jgi:hypothetical protein
MRAATLSGRMREPHDPIHNPPPKTASTDPAPTARLDARAREWGDRGANFFARLGMSRLLAGILLIVLGILVIAIPAVAIILIGIAAIVLGILILVGQ